MQRRFNILMVLVVVCGWGFAQKVGSTLAVGTVIPSIACDANPNQTYALYLPSNISPKKNWPIIYMFDPGARGPLAVETARAAAEKYGYIVAASNNSHNGPLGGFTEAAEAMWRDTQMKLPVDEHRRYTAGMSGGARVATHIAMGCKDCIAGVIANAASFMGQTVPPPDMKFAYFATVGNADFNFPEFVALRKKLEDVHARYKIRVFEGEHGYAPSDVWDETLDWMDLQAMAAGTLARDPQRIQQSMEQRLARVKQLSADGDLLESVRELQSVVRDFSPLTDVTGAREQLAAATKGKAFKNAEREEADQVSRQAQLTAEISSQIAGIADGLEAVAYNELRNQMAELKKKADASAKKNDRDSLLYRRTRQQVVAEAYENGQAAFDLKKYDQALQDFEISSAGARHPEYSQFQRARAYAKKGDKKDTIATLKLAIQSGFDDASQLQEEEFNGLRGMAEFQALVSQLTEKK
jgi:hypothetical protein